MNFSVDTHAHIYLDDFSGDRDDMMRRCLAAGVEKIYMPNIDHSTVDSMLETELRFPSQCIPTMGLHPCSVKKDFARELYMVEEWLSKRQFAAVGEIGTDLYWDKTYWEEQKEAFNIQVNWAIRYGLPVVIHCRESLDQTLDMVEQISDKRLYGVFHCFGGTKEQADRIIGAGFYLGIGGIITFRKAALDLDPVLKEIDPQHVVLETDSPYLSPVPHRGRRNEPSYIPLIAGKLAEIYGMAVEKVMEMTTQNALRLFAASQAHWS
jgi:TatD DNase family protein